MLCSLENLCLFDLDEKPQNSGKNRTELGNDNIRFSETMSQKFHLIVIIGTLFILNCSNFSTTLVAEVSNTEAEILPLTSFLFAHRDQMRVGWHIAPRKPVVGDLRTVSENPAGSIFVQLKPRRNEGEYQLALRVLRDGSHQFFRIREFTGGKSLNHKLYLTVPFELLIGAIQGEALRSLFPYDRVEFGGWQHQVTYDWETTELLAKSFTKPGTQIFPREDLVQGEKLIIPWNSLRPDLELKPLAVRDPLFIRKDESGLRYAYYRIQPGDTLYSSVVIRFMGKTKHNARSQNASDLLVLNRLADARQLSPGQLIKIPLEWIQPEYLHQVPSIYRISEYTNDGNKLSSPQSQTSTDSGWPQTGSFYQTNTINQH